MMHQLLRSVCPTRLSTLIPRRQLSLIKPGDLRPPEAPKAVLGGSRTSGDSVLFRHVKGRSVLWKAIVAIAMVPVWGFLGYTTYTLEDQLPRDNVTTTKSYSPEWIRQTTRKSSKLMGLIYVTFGLAVAAYWTGRTLHTVRYLVLKKGGNFVSFITYTAPGLTPRVTTVPSTHLRVVRPRIQTRERLLVHVKDHNAFKFRIIIEEGIISNRAVFNQVLGLPTNL